MTDFLIYIAKVSACLSVFYFLFWIFLKKLSFHTSNRMLLLISLAISFMIPILEINHESEISKKFAYSPLQNPPFFEPVQPQVLIEEVDWVSGIGLMDLLVTVYSVGVFICLIKFFISIFKIVNLKIKSRKKTEGKFVLIPTESASAFSFFRWIFLPTAVYANGNVALIAHEKAHGNFCHSADLLIAELAKAFMWFNPTIYLFTKSLKLIHEFQADAEVPKNEIKTSEYLLLLLEHVQKQNQVSPNKLYSYFHNSQLKQRIEMMTNPKSNRKQLAKYLLVVPIAIFMVIIFSKGTRQILEPSSLAFVGGEQFTGILVEEENNEPSISPIKDEFLKKMSAGYGYTIHPIFKVKKMHTGADFVADTGAEIQATADGVVIKTENSNRGYGKRIIIDHKNGILTSYSHLSKFNVKLNDEVKMREVIGFVGTTGASVSPHLHYEVILNGEKVNPINYMKGNGTAAKDSVSLD